MDPHFAFWYDRAQFDADLAELIHTASASVELRAPSHSWSKRWDQIEESYQSYPSTAPLSVLSDRPASPLTSAMEGISFGATPMQLPGQPPNYIAAPEPDHEATRQASDATNFGSTEAFYPNCPPYEQMDLDFRQRLIAKTELLRAQSRSASPHPAQEFDDTASEKRITGANQIPVASDRKSDFRSMREATPDLTSSLQKPTKKKYVKGSLHSNTKTTKTKTGANTFPVAKARSSNFQSLRKGSTGETSGKGKQSSPKKSESTFSRRSLRLTPITPESKKGKKTTRWDKPPPAPDSVRRSKRGQESREEDLRKMSTSTTSTSNDKGLDEHESKTED